MKYESVIGLEVHAQLSTKSKIFCGCSTTFGAEPNSQTCPVCLGMPGVLPVLNKHVVESAIKLCIATDSKLRHNNIFARKNYFYPDLPKGYQVSQFDKPICENGFVEIDTNDGVKKIGLIRIHMEEDAGKSVHDESYVDDEETLIDLNRCGVPLLEIVSEPDIRSPQEAAKYLTKLRTMVRYLRICDGNMEEGSMRCDANISLRPVGQQEYGTRTELKNMNSISNVEKALQFEIDRQKNILAEGGSIEQQTLSWNADSNVAAPMRGKEESHDYRYFPEPDLIPLEISQEWFEQIKEQLPEMAGAKRERFMREFQLQEYAADVLTANREIAEYFEELTKNCTDAKLAANWIIGEVMRVLNDQKQEIGEFKLTPRDLGALINLVSSKEINTNAAKKVFDKMLQTGEPAGKIVDDLGLKQISDQSEIEKIIDEVLANHAEDVSSFREGNQKVFGFLVGQIMRASKGKADPGVVNSILRNKLG